MSSRYCVAIAVAMLVVGVVLGACGNGVTSQEQTQTALAGGEAFGAQPTGTVPRATIPPATASVKSGSPSASPSTTNGGGSPVSSQGNQKQWSAPPAMQLEQGKDYS